MAIRKLADAGQALHGEARREEGFEVSPSRQMIEDGEAVLAELRWEPGRRAREIGDVLGWPDRRVEAALAYLLGLALVVDTWAIERSCWVWGLVTP